MFEIGFSEITHCLIKNIRNLKRTDTDVWWGRYQVCLLFRPFWIGFLSSSYSDFAVCKISRLRAEIFGVDALGLCVEALGCRFVAVPQQAGSSCAVCSVRSCWRALVTWPAGSSCFLVTGVTCLVQQTLTFDTLLLEQQTGRVCCLIYALPKAGGLLLEFLCALSFPCGQIPACAEDQVKRLVEESCTRA